MSSNPSQHRHVSWFGKLPCVGDFCSHNMPASLQSTLDEWLSHIIQQGQETHGDAWTQAYFETPVHGFICARNTLPSFEEEMAVGIIMPSVDKAGREFPFILIEQLPVQANQHLSEQSISNWFLYAHAKCADALNEEWTLDHLNQALLDLPLLQDETTPETRTWTETKTGHSQWFRIGFDGSIQWALECEGLPNTQAFETLLGLDHTQS